MSNNRSSYYAEEAFVEKFRNLFKRKRKVNAGDLGVYEDTLTFTSIGNTSRAIHYDVFIKVKAIEVYDDLVEVEVVDVTISEAASEDTCKFIKHENLRYIKPSKVKWQAINKKQ